MANKPNVRHLKIFSLIIANVPKYDQIGVIPQRRSFQQHHNVWIEL